MRQINIHRTSLKMMTLGMLMRAFRKTEEILQVDFAERLKGSKQFLSNVENTPKKVKFVSSSFGLLNK